jgi:hypothetical protein
MTIPGIEKVGYQSHPTISPKVEISNIARTGKKLEAKETETKPPPTQKGWEKLQEKRKDEERNRNRNRNRNSKQTSPAIERAEPRPGKEERGDNRRQKEERAVTRKMLKQEMNWGSASGGTSRGHEGVNQFSLRPVCVRY